jgi:hypothetical protein
MNSAIQLETQEPTAKQLIQSKFSLEELASYDFDSPFSLSTLL